jgi:uncharacterized cupredoxin-like copper-binding protein
MASEGPDQEQRERQVYDRLALPLLIPATVFLFAVLVIYGLSRIYLELDHYHIRSVSMATPLAIGVSLMILLTSAFLASQRRIAAFQIVAIFVVAASLLTAGSIWAAVHTESKTEGGVVTTATPGGTGTPPATAGVNVALIDPPFHITVEPASFAAGAVTFNVTNGGTIIHNFRLIKTDLSADSLPLDSTGFKVDETQVTVAGHIAEFASGTTKTLDLTLEAGKYVLICNVATHYDQGMHAAFTIN